jgi:adenine-specific DNA-methyltransferase
VARRTGRQRRSPAADVSSALSYSHPTETSPLRPDIGTQAQFKKIKKPANLRYDSSLSPALEWDAQNPAREQSEALIRKIMEAATIEEAREGARQLQVISKPFLNWAGKAERLSFDVPSLPLFVHERLSTKAILETLTGHRHDAAQRNMFDLFGDPQRSITDQVLKAYEHGPWQNRMILGDSLIVMNSLVQYEGLGGKVQMIYMDPPYGVKFGSNFQPFVRNPDVDHGADEDMTREPEMVQAYRDTWELGLHSYLTYLRDRLKISRELLKPSGSIFVQISDENIHHVRELMDEIFGSENFVSQISFQTTSGFETATIATLGDFLLWYAKDKSKVKVNRVFAEQPTIVGEGNARWLLLEDDETYRGVTAAERRGEVSLPANCRLYKPDNLISQGAPSEPQPFEYEGKVYEPKAGSHWKANYPLGMQRLAQANRLHIAENSLQYRRFASDFPYEQIGNIWTDTQTGSFTEKKKYVVQTNPKVVERCIFLASDPADLILDPTCGSGTTAYVAEQWGRRWITIDVSRVPLALTRQRLLTATFPYYELIDESRGPSGGFVYKRKQNKKGEEIGGIVPHLKLENIANNEPPKEEVLLDRPEVVGKITRISGPFCVESTIPAPMDLERDVETEAGDTASFTDRMIEIVRKSPVIRLAGNQVITLKNIRRPAKSLFLSAEGLIVNGEEKSTAFVFGPENGAITETLLWDAAREAYIKGFARLIAIGFAIEAKARMFIENSADVIGIPGAYVQATTDLTMSDLLKNMRSSQVFSVCGLPEIRLRQAETDQGSRYQVQLLGLDTFDPVTMESHHLKGSDVPAWFLDIDYNDLCFHVSQAFFPRTSAWESLKKALRATHQESVWDHLAGDTSAPFEAGDHKQVAVKVIDDRGNELLAVKKISETET